MILAQRHTRMSQSREGSTVVVVMALIALLLIYSLANLRLLDHLRGELKLLEARQVSRLETTATNTPPQFPLSLENRGTTGGETSSQEVAHGAD
jgi:hypothetical protein